ncbi:type II toxin-antitoxin system VapC family toxin [Nocardia sp. MW-W600-9]
MRQISQREFRNNSAAIMDAVEAGETIRLTRNGVEIAGELDPASLPELPEITAITLAELNQGVAMAKDPVIRAARSEQLGAAIVEFDPLPFDEAAATRYATLVALTSAANRDPRPRRMDLLIAAIASANDLPVSTPGTRPTSRGW